LKRSGAVPDESTNNMGTEQPLALELLDTPGPQWDPRLFIMTESQAPVSSLLCLVSCSVIG
jgi:hypothetical protein